MSRPRAETMPAVTVEPRPNGLPIAIIQSPTRTWSLSAHSTNGNGSGRSILSSARSVLLSVPISLAGILAVVAEDDGDLVGVGDDVVVGDDEARSVDHEAGAEREAAPRLLLLLLLVAVEELLEELLERRAGRELRHLRRVGLPPRRQRPCGSRC